MDANGSQALRSVHGDLLGQLAPATSVDPFTVLPRELVEMILEYLDFRQRIACSRVSKQWTLFIRSCPGLWSDLNLSGARKSVKNAFISRAINVARAKIRAASLRRMQDTDKAMSALFRHCPLEELRLADGGLQSQGLVELIAKAKTLTTLRLGDGTEIGPRTVHQLLPYLQRFECMNLSATRLAGSPPGLGVQQLPSLKELTIKSDTGSFLSIFEVAKCAPNLEYLRVELKQEFSAGDLAMLRRLEHFEVCARSIDFDAIQLPQSIKSLSIDVATDTTSNALSADLRWCLPRLEQLYLRIGIQEGMTGLIDLVLSTSDSISQGDRNGMEFPDEGVTQDPSALKKLALPRSVIPYYMRPTLLEILSEPRLAKLERLHLPGAFLKDTDVAGLTAALPQLATIDLSGNDITGVTLKDLILGSKHRILKLIMVNDCREMSCDAVEWARAQGVRVEFKMIELGNGGRKIRF